MEPGSYNITATPALRPENYQAVMQKAAYGNAIEQAARKFQGFIIGLWILNTCLIFTHRLLHREKPLGIKLEHPLEDQVIYEKSLEIELTERQQDLVKHLDNILFTVNYALLSFLMVLQFIPYGKVTVSGGP